MTKKEVMTKLKSKFLDATLDMGRIQKVRTLYSKVKELPITDSAAVPAEVEQEFMDI